VLDEALCPVTKTCFHRSTGPSLRATGGVVDALRRRSGRIPSLWTYLHMHAAIGRRWVHE
jgi:hypothetical protein